MAIEADKIKMGDKYRAANAGLMAGVREAFPGTSAAISGASENIVDSYRKGGVPGAIGATVRNTMVPAIGLADDVMRGAKIALDPAANALKTAVTGDASPIGSAQASPVSPSSAPSGPGSPRQGLGAGVSGVTNYENAKVSEAGNGLFRVDETGRSPLFTDNVQRGLAERNLGGGPMTVNLRDGNAAMARANAVRAETIDSLAGGRGGAGGGVIGSWQKEPDRFQGQIDDILFRGANSRAKRAMLGQLMGAQQAEADRGLKGEELAQRGQLGEAANALKAQELKQLDALGLRKDAMEQAKLGFDREQLAAGQGLRDAQANYYNAGARGERGGAAKKGDGFKSMQSFLSSAFPETDETKGRTAEMMSRYANAEVPVDPNNPNGPKARLVDVWAQDEATGASYLQNLMVNQGAQEIAENQKGTKLTNTQITGGLRAPLASDDGYNMFTAPVAGLFGSKVVPTNQGALPYSEFEKRNLQGLLAARLQN